MNNFTSQGGYKSIVSLGFFCGPSQELERMGLRSYSLPFDWLITEDFKVVLSLIESNFESFLKEENLEQEKEVNPKYYYDTEQMIHFYHDFSASLNLPDQLQFVKEKYARRINRFYKIISEPTLFIRYCHSKEEYRWVCENKSSIESLLKQKNSHNEIVFVCNSEDVENEDREAIGNLFIVQRDSNDIVCRHFIQKSKPLRTYIESKVHIGVLKRIGNYYRLYKKKIEKRRKANP